MSNAFDQIYILIPSLNPEESLIKYVDDLKNHGFNRIMIVDDGSKDETQFIFSKLEEAGYTVLHHEVNKGKGAALKTGFQYVLDNAEDIKGIITVDSDGQHLSEDTKKVAETLLNNPNTFILGCRDFDAENVPPKSKAGNKITSRMFKLLYQKTVSDTQTGLRAIPMTIVPDLIKLRGQRFEYETAMLIDVMDSDTPIIEVPIETVYIDSNRETHFNPFWDSIKIYLVIFKYFILFSCSGILSFLVDIGAYALFSKLVFKNMSPEYCILFGTIAARVISSILNFVVNKNGVFKSSNGLGKSLARYYLLCICRALLSSGIVALIFFATKWDTTLIKTIIEFVLFLTCFKLQKQWVFKNSKSQYDIWICIILIVISLAFIPMYIGDIWDKFAMMFV